MEREKDLLSNELSDNNEKLLKLADEKNEWEKEKALLVEKVNVLTKKKLLWKKRQRIREKKMRYK